MIDLSHEDAVCLFRFLKRRESEIEECLVPLLTRIERMLYKTMSIEELESLTGNQSSIDVQQRPNREP